MEEPPIWNYGGERLDVPRDGAGDGIRTRDINLGKVALYQLSYSRPSSTFIFPRRKLGVKLQLSAPGEFSDVNKSAT
jgi:hypothetical protein